ncbi:transposase [Telmatocola sphagniphila]|uniref:Transposase n=1 Tax=Telmatocola sphagniphila TaxID=1123043 RepID=A0A8E6B4W4_9BACT|nr:transposase [Telmatocola sphagniphila]
MYHADLQDKIWQEIEPLLLPNEPPRDQRGRSQIPNTMVMCGIFFVLISGLLWEDIPR